MANSYQLVDPIVSIHEDTLMLAIANAKQAMRWNEEPENSAYWQGHIDAYKSLLKGML